MAKAEGAHGTRYWGSWGPLDAAGKSDIQIRRHSKRPETRENKAQTPHGTNLTH